MSRNSSRGFNLQAMEAGKTSDEPDREEPPLLHGFERNLEAEEVQIGFINLVIFSV